MQTAWKSNPDIQQIYVKAESNDFLTLYHRIIKQVKRQKIQQIKTIWLSKIAQTEANKHEITKPIVDILEQNPNAVYKYFNNGLISQSEVEHIQLECVREITHDDNFLQAISYLTDSELERDVYDWFLGRNLSPTTLRSLGIRYAIDNVELAKVSLRFLVTLFARASQPLLLYIDKIEDLLLDTSAEVRSVNIGALYSLAEIFSRENCFLCLSGVTDAWNGLPEDFFARVQCVDISNLSLDESLNLMKTYLSSSDEFSPYTNEEDIYPYTEASVREMVRLSHGNIRQILHLAYEAFEEAAPNQAPIEVETVKKAALSFNKYFDRQTILKEIADILRKARLPFVENEKLLDDIYLEIAAPDSKEPTVLIQVSEPIFSEDEIQKTINFASHAQIFPKAKLIMVVAGYLSPELHKKLSEVVDYCLIYTPDTFKIDFSEILDSFIVTTESRSTSSTEIEKLSEGIQTLLTQLKPLLEKRLYDSQKLEQQFSDYIQRLQNLNEEMREQYKSAVGGMTVVAIAISIVLIPELLSLITQSTVTVFSSPWLWIYLATLGTIYWNYSALYNDNQLAKYLGITFAVILLFVILVLLLTSSELISWINKFLVSAVKVLISPLTLGIIGVSLSSLLLFWGALNTLKRRELQKQTIMKIEKYKKDDTFSFMIPLEENKLTKSSRLNDLVINPLKYATPFFLSIGIIYAFNIFATNITIFLAIAGGLLSPLLFLRIPVYKTDKK